MAQILITGGAGFIGSHLAEHHLNKGDSVWVIDNFASGRKENIEACIKNPRFRFSKEDLITADLQEPISWADSIYHLAAVVGYHVVLKRPIDTLTLNIHLCEKMVQGVAAFNPKAKILITSSSEVYGNQYGGPLNEDLPLYFSSKGKSQKNYALAKYVNEMTALSYIEEKGIFVVIARIFNTSGSRQGSYTGSYVLPGFIEKALAHQPITVYGSGEQTRSFCSVHDTVQMLTRFLDTAKNNGEILNIGSNEEISINDLASLVRKRAKSHSQIVHIPYEEAYGRTFYETMRRRPDLTKMQRLLNYTPSYTIDMIIDEMIAYFKKSAPSS